MTIVSLPRARQGAAPSRHNALHLAFDARCPDSPNGFHIRRRGELRCLCCRCRLPLTVPERESPTTQVPVLGDTYMSQVMSVTFVNTVRLAHAQAEKLLDASVEGSPAEDRYRRLVGHLEAALVEVTGDAEVMS